MAKRHLQIRFRIQVPRTLGTQQGFNGSCTGTSEAVVGLHQS